MPRERIKKSGPSPKSRERIKTGGPVKVLTKTVKKVAKAAAKPRGAAGKKKRTTKR